MQRTELVLLAVLTIGSLVLSVSAYCNFDTSNRTYVGDNVTNCPYTTIYNETVTSNQSLTYWNGTGYSIATVDQRTVNGSLGWCGTYSYPVLSGLVYVGSTYHTLDLQLPLPWCVTSTMFGGCLALRQNQWDRPPLVFNERPVRCFNCTSNPFTQEPSEYPLWDKGGYYRGTVTLSIDDACLALAGPPSYTAPDPAQVKFIWNAANSTFNYPAVNSTLGQMRWWSHMGTARNSAGLPVPEVSYCTSNCSTLPTVTCQTPRFTGLTRWRNPVQLVCRDLNWGYVWRVDNRYGPNLHFDWRLYDIYNVSAIPPAFGSNLKLETEYGAPYDMIFRYPYFGYVEPFGRPAVPRWNESTSAHAASAYSTFYIPNYLDQDYTGLEHNTRFNLYAGAPDHYESTHIMAALVGFFDVNQLFQMYQFPLITTFNLAAINASATFDEDIPRLILVALCSPANPGLFNDVQAFLSTYNLSQFCAAVNNDTMTWSYFLGELGTALNLGSLVDPIPGCICGTPSVPCGSEVGTAVKFHYDYFYAAQGPPPNITVVPVCRVTNATFVNITMPPFDLFNNTGNLTSLASNISNYINMPPPTNKSGSPLYITYSTNTYGVIWNIANGDTTTSDPAVTIRWGMGEYTLPNGSVVNYTVPYAGQSPTLLNLMPAKVHWIFSRTLNAHTYVSNVGLSCFTAGDCASKVPMDPAPPAWSAKAMIIPVNDTTPLPECQCYVNIPCSAGAFLTETNITTNLTTLPGPPPPPTPPPAPVPPPPNLFPMPEVCNGLDDNLNNITDDVPGVGLACGMFTVGNCQQGTLQCVNTSLTCVGEVLPQAEQCIPGDFDCDGIDMNVPGLNHTCGNNTGTCREGILICDGMNPLPICNGSIGPIPEICGDGLDNDCNGLVDDGCNLTPSPPPSPAPTPTPTSSVSPSPPSPTSSPSPVPTPTPSPTPSSNVPDLTNPLSLIKYILSLIGVVLPTLSFNISAAVILLSMVLLLLVSCCIRSNREMSRIVKFNPKRGPPTQ